jgi:hypothetical protein
MAPAILPVPATHAAGASAWIRQVRSAARARLGEGILAVAPELSDDQIRTLAMYAEDFACQLLDACGFPERVAEMRAISAAEQEAAPGGDGAA